VVSSLPSQIVSLSSKSALRLIARLDIKGANLIKGIHLEGLRVVGDPQLHAAQYYADGADEIIYMDTVASLYGRNNLIDVVSRATEHVFVPITVGGGIRSVEDARTLLRAGADKVAINTAAVKDPNLIRELSDVWGASTIFCQLRPNEPPKESGRPTPTMAASEPVLTPSNGQLMARASELEKYLSPRLTKREPKKDSIVS